MQAGHALEQGPVEHQKYLSRHYDKESLPLWHPRYVQSCITINESLAEIRRRSLYAYSCCTWVSSLCSRSESCGSLCISSAMALGDFRPSIDLIVSRSETYTNTTLAQSRLPRRARLASICANTLAFETIGAFRALCVALDFPPSTAVPYQHDMLWQNSTEVEKIS